MLIEIYIIKYDRYACTYIIETIKTLDFIIVIA